jgi:DNA-directed RNA polymerase subunit M/transcription elongation factor TFIIS
MHFCDKCSNMLYIRLLEEEADSLIYYCRNCGNTGQPITKNNICVLNTAITTKEKAYLQDVNEYTKLDPTLPRTQNIKCPNQLCSSNKVIDVKDEGEASTSSKAKNEVIYLRYDDINMNYIYICTQCDAIWKTTDQ